MSIKIIKNTMTEPIETTCQICKSIFSYTFDEVKREDHYNFFGMKDGVRRFIICPVCKSDIDMSTNDDGSINMKDGGKEE